MSPRYDEHMVLRRRIAVIEHYERVVLTIGNGGGVTQRLSASSDWAHLPYHIKSLLFRDITESTTICLVHCIAVYGVELLAAVMPRTGPYARSEETKA